MVLQIAGVQKSTTTTSRKIFQKEIFDSARKTFPMLLSSALARKWPPWWPTGLGMIYPNCDACNTDDKHLQPVLKHRVCAMSYTYLISNCQILIYIMLEKK